MTPTPPQDSKVPLETLLRLKRAERPSPEFWAEFDAGLRRKQLVAMVERRSVWSSISAALPRWAWLSLPTGAVAAGVFTWMVVSPQTPTVSASATVASTPVAPLPSADVAPVLVAQVEQAPAPVMEDAAPAQVEAAAPVSAPALSFLASAPAPSAPSESFAGSLSLEPAYRPTFRPAAATLTARTQNVDTTETDVSAWSDPKKARLMAYADNTLASTSGDRLRNSRAPDRVARRLSQHALEDSMGRLDVDGGRLTIRF